MEATHAGKRDLKKMMESLLESQAKAEVRQIRKQNAPGPEGSVSKSVRAEWQEEGDVL